jgi:hypothetical protein
MTRYERKLFFEQLMAMREDYRAESHASTGMTLDETIIFAEQRYNDAAAADLAEAAVIAATASKANPAAF